MERVKFSQLQVGKEYYIEPKEKYATNNNMKHTGRFLGYMKPDFFPDTIQVASFDNFYRPTGVLIAMDKKNYIDIAWNFYAMKKRDIQIDFEQRCLTTILRNRIGDPYFEW
jgi:hypothetical protein